MADKPNQNSPILVKIHGQEYPIRAQGDEDYIRKVAQYVDERMSLIEAHTSVSSLARLAILAALNIADELFTVRGEKEHLMENLEEKARRISEFLDKNFK